MDPQSLNASHESLNQERCDDAMSHYTIVHPSTVFHDRTRLLSNNPGHCLKTHTGSHLKHEVTAASANMVMSHSTIVNPSTVFHDRTRPLSTNSGHCLGNDAGSHLEDEDTAASSIIVWNSIAQNSLGIIRSYRKGNTYRAKMNRL